MYAPLLEQTLVVVQPPRFFVEAGLAKPGETWTLSKAVYGLKISRKAWGNCRDKNFRKLKWQAKSDFFELVQCDADTQVWKMVPSGDHSVMLGLVVVYVDDFLTLCPPGAMREGFIPALQGIWTLRPETVLVPGSDITFLGFEFSHKPDGVRIGQRRFTVCWKSTVLNQIAEFQLSQFRWRVQAKLMFHLRTTFASFKLLRLPGQRADLAYFVSLLSSALSQFCTWSFSLANKILRYLQCAGMLVFASPNQGSCPVCRLDAMPALPALVPSLRLG